ncbi:fibrillin-1-like [Xenia sp. Carnegie-2017]|uniref:fibrillin-1-like n=1 Tax=Xenia sp. Carnegie-2017 TaxID=2897299 RepID=UPI001F0369B8|nr:fibrillin-1-like [Xenia sp. Carnegie-2017]
MNLCDLRNRSPCPKGLSCEKLRHWAGRGYCVDLCDKCVRIKLNVVFLYEFSDIDECIKDHSHKCSYSAGEECFNIKGGYKCVCLPGLKRENGKCVDLDECKTGRHDCDPNAKCKNLPKRGYECHCKPGFKQYNNGRVCQDINECSNSSKCSPYANCTNLPGSYECSRCGPGFTGDGINCNDIDECEELRPCSINAMCNNTFGSYQCTCNKGFYGNGAVCTDINECSMRTDECPYTSKCINTPGSYMCKCPEGYNMVDDACEDIDECETSINKCHKNARCTNFIGSYKCRCEDGFKHLSNGRFCLKDSSNREITFIISVVSAFILFVIWILCCFCLVRKTKTSSKKRVKKSDDREPLIDKSHRATPVFMFHSNDSRNTKSVTTSLFRVK